MIRRLSAVLCVAVMSACSASGLNFYQDERIEITAPGDREEVTMPVEVEWTVEAFAVTGRDGSDRQDAGYFGIYVDRAPQPPGQTQEWLVRDDPRCTGDCPDTAYLAGLNVFSTTQTTFTITSLPVPTGDAAKRRDRHEATIVLLNGKGERIGESAFVVEFEIERGLG